VWDEYLSQYIIIYIPDLVMTNIIDDVENPLFDDVTTTDVVETRDDIVRRSFLSTVENLTDRLGDDPEKWAWGEVHEMTFTHPMGEKLPFFNLKPVPIGGDDFTINAGLWDNEHPYAMKSGGVIRLIVDFSAPETNTIISPPGQSGQYMSPHYDDLVESWVSNEQIPMHFLDAEELPTILILTGE
jgi:penicillin amidase